MTTGVLGGVMSAFVALLSVSAVAVSVLGAVLLVLWMFPRFFASLFSREDPQKLLDELLADEEREMTLFKTGKRQASPKKVAENTNSCNVTIEESSPPAVSAEPVSGVQKTLSASAESVVETIALSAAEAKNDDAADDIVPFRVTPSRPAPEPVSDENWTRVLRKDEEQLASLRARVESLTSARDQALADAAAQKSVAEREHARATEIEKELRDRKRQSLQRIAELENDLKTQGAAKAMLSTQLCDVEARLVDLQDANARVADLEANVAELASAKDTLEASLRNASHLADSEAENAKAATDALAAQLETASLNLAAAEVTNAKIENENAAKDAELALLSARLAAQASDHAAELAAAHDASAQLVADLESRDAEMTLLGASKKALEAELKVRTADYERLCGKECDREAQVARLNARVSELEALAASLQARVDASAATSSELEQALESKISEVEELGALIAKHAAVAAEKDAAMDALRSTVDTISASNDELSQAHKAQLDDCDSLRAAITVLEEAAAAKDAEISELIAANGQIDTFIQRIAALEAALSAANSSDAVSADEDVLERLRSEIASNAAEMESLQQINNERLISCTTLAEELASVRAELDAERESRRALEEGAMKTSIDDTAELHAQLVESVKIRNELSEQIIKAERRLNLTEIANKRRMELFRMDVDELTAERDELRDRVESLSELVRQHGVELQRATQLSSELVSESAIDP